MTDAERQELDVLRKGLNRRAGVEQELWDVYNGKRDLPDAEQCRQWALTLGVPEEYRS